MKTMRVLALLIFGACGAQDAEVRDVGGGEASTQSGLRAPESVLHFRSDWTIAQSAPLVVGGKARVVYDESRLPQCRGELNGGPSWTITAHWSVNGGPVQSAWVAGRASVPNPAPPVLELKDAGDLAIWFEVTGRWGCQGWDSDYGRNFHFVIERAAAIHFEPSWVTNVFGLPTQGDALVVRYDLMRLPSCRQTYNGMPTWEILMFWRFDGGPVSSTPMTAVNGHQREAAPAVLSIPRSARNVEMWFKSSDRAGCVQWDSRYGENHRFQVR